MTTDFKAAIAAAVDGKSLPEETAYEAMGHIMDGHATPAQLAGFLVALRMKGETVEELTGFARAMRERCALIAPQVSGRLTDTCGTGGAPIKTFNVSTLSAFVAAGFEHSIANMFFFPLALLLKWHGLALPAGGDAITVAGMLGNLGPVIAGNVIGGSVLVALVYWVIYRRGRTGAGDATPA